MDSAHQDHDSIAPPGLNVLDEVTCPHCWERFSPESTLWLSEHPDLLGDAKLGFDQAKRFLPSRFNSGGNAIDEMGHRATRLACPNCHLEIPRTLFQLRSVYFSIFGAPACGKSYFLAAMTWRLRQVLPSLFSVSLNDVDAVSNGRLHEYEELQFMNPDPDTPVAIPKTEEQGEMYDNVNMGDHTLVLPRPFLFNLQPLNRHPMAGKSQSVARVMCLYDNAGESFLPGTDKSTSPVTRHLALSKCLFFCFDPTQDPRFRRACAGHSKDPQMVARNGRLEREATVRQDTILLEAIHRIRRHAGLRDDQLHQRPLVIVVTKWDSWKQLLPEIGREEPYKRIEGQAVHALDTKRVQDVSTQVGQLLTKLCPEVVAAAEGFAENLLFIPVSATGRSPELDPDTGSLGIRPSEMDPYWVEVPMMFALHHWAVGLIGASYSKRSHAEADKPIQA